MNHEFTLTYHNEAIAMIQQNVKNVSAAGYQLKNKLFNIVAQNEQAKVLIVHGNGKFYSRGGDKQTMLDIITQKITFADGRLHDLYFDFPLPIISAIQGHAFGGGFTEGFYGDIVILSEISVYAASFMKNGFTPGMGSTFLLPYYLGNALGWEMLFTAEDYTGADLRDRGATVRVVEQGKVISKAIQMATELVKMPRASLSLLKSHRVATIKNKVMKCIEMELLMHKTTMGNPHTLQTIMKLFENLKE